MSQLSPTPRAVSGKCKRQLPGVCRYRVCIKSRRFAVKAHSTRLSISHIDSVVCVLRFKRILFYLPLFPTRLSRPSRSAKARMLQKVREDTPVQLVSYSVFPAICTYLIAVHKLYNSSRNRLLSSLTVSL